jgi:hypothetical protein
MIEMTTTARKPEATPDARTACAELTTVRIAGLGTSRMAFGMRPLNNQQLKTTDMIDHKKAIKDYSTDSLVQILRDLQRKHQHDQWDIGRISAIKSTLKKRGISLS